MDYQLTTNEIPHLIVEAKKIGHTFTATKKLRKTEYTLSYVQSAFGQAFAEVLEQAKSYTEDTQIPYAVITNGVEWFLLNLLKPPGKTISELKCFYFGNLLSDDSGIDLFWNLLSEQSVSQGGAGSGLTIDIFQPPIYSNQMRILYGLNTHV